MIERFIHHPKIDAARCQFNGEPIKPEITKLHQATESNNCKFRTFTTPTSNANAIVGRELSTDRAVKKTVRNFDVSGNLPSRCGPAPVVGGAFGRIKRVEV